MICCLLVCMWACVNFKMDYACDIYAESIHDLIMVASIYDY